MPAESAPASPTKKAPFCFCQAKPSLATIFFFAKAAAETCDAKTCYEKYIYAVEKCDRCSATWIEGVSGRMSDV